VNGRQIEIRHLDDGYEPDRCKANTERLIRDEVLALFGYIGTPTSLAALPLATAAKLPFIAPFTGAMGLREPFHRDGVSPARLLQRRNRADRAAAHQPGLKKIAVFYQNDAYGKAGLSTA
jgi:branched-chain amino acid transport system substrate-binding protein